MALRGLRDLSDPLPIIKNKTLALTSGQEDVDVKYLGGNLPAFHQWVHLLISPCADRLLLPGSAFFPVSDQFLEGEH